MGHETAIAAAVSRIPSLTGFSEFRYRMTKAKLTLSRDVDGTWVCRQREHHGSAAGGIGSEQNRAARSASARLAREQRDRQIQIASRSAFLMVSSFAECCRRIPHDDPAALSLGDACVVRTRDGKLIEARCGASSYGDASVLTGRDIRLCDHEGNSVVKLRRTEHHAP